MLEITLGSIQHLRTIGFGNIEKAVRLTQGVPYAKVISDRDFEQALKAKHQVCRLADGRLRVSRADGSVTVIGSKDEFLAARELFKMMKCSR